MEYFTNSFVVRCTSDEYGDEPVAIFRTREAANVFVEMAQRNFDVKNAKYRITPLTIVH